MTTENYTEQFQGTRPLPGPVRDRLLDGSHVIHMDAVRPVFGPMNMPGNLCFLCEGQIRVSQSSSTAREIVLYCVNAGESRVLATACMLAEDACNAECIAGTEVTAIIFPKPALDRLVTKAEAFRKFVFAASSRRLIDLLRVADDVIFRYKDVRLSEQLSALDGDDKEISATQQQLASGLRPAREAVSRVLQDFLKREVIAQSPGRSAMRTNRRCAPWSTAGRPGSSDFSDIVTEVPELKLYSL